MRDDAGLRSQQFTEQVEQRRDRYSEGASQAWRSLPDATVGRFLDTRGQMLQQNHAQEQHEMEMLQSAEELGLSELRRKTAAQELEWAQQLHATDAMDLDLEDKRSAVALRKAQTEKAINDLKTSGRKEWFGLTPEEMDYSIAELGIFGQMQGGRMTFTKPPPERVEASRARMKARENAHLKWMEHRGQSGTPESRITLQIDRLLRTLDSSLLPMEEEERLIKDIKELLDQRRKMRRAIGRSGGGGDDQDEETMFDQMRKNFVRDAEKYGEK